MARTTREEQIVNDLQEQLDQIQRARDNERRRYEALAKAQQLRLQIIALGHAPVISLDKLDQACNHVDATTVLLDDVERAALKDEFVSAREEQPPAEPPPVEEPPPEEPVDAEPVGPSEPVPEEAVVGGP